MKSSLIPSEDSARMNVTRELSLEPTDERMIPEHSNRDTFWEHVHRYAFASRFVRDKRVLDIACGEGYGAAALRQSGAAHVIGVDISEATCLHAAAKYGLDVRCGSAERIPVGDQSIDVVVSFETVEHIPSPGAFLDECIRILVPGGRIIVSTPNKAVYTDALGTRNPYHCSEMTQAEFAAALQSRFHQTCLYNQRPHSAPWWSTRSLLCENTLWSSIRGFRNIRRLVQNILMPELNQDLTNEQRTSILDLISQARRRPVALVNPYTVQRQRKWVAEEASYIVATAIR